MNLKTYTRDFNDVLQCVNPQEVDACISLLKEAYDNNRQVFIFGNGGSGANASHICEDLAKDTLQNFDTQKRLRVMSLTDNTSAILAWANDNGYESIFAEQMKNFAQAGDIAIAISGSGNSPNVLCAVEYANNHGLATVGCTGYDGGKLQDLAQHNIHIPSHNMGMVESVHLIIFHYIIKTLKGRFAQS